jgi:aminopeptidase
MASAFRSGAARLAVIGEDPSLLSGQDPGKIARANRSRSVAYKPTLDLISSFSMNWSLVPYVTSSWAAAVFPQYPLDKAVTRLWQIVFAATRATEPDAVAAWNAHNGDLRARTSLLNGKRYSALHFRGPDTDLRVGLADGHKWAGGAAIARNGITCNTNIPTEEVFTAPHRSRVEGYVTSTRPLSYMGTTISDIRVRFEQGRIVEASAKRGSEIFQQLLEVDEGARRLGEVALVPCSSQISRSGILFHNTLFDENAASHLALGQSYSKCFIDGSDQEKDDFRARGANSSLMHVDWMIGSPDLQVDGLSEGGAIDPIMRSGEWTT